MKWQDDSTSQAVYDDLKTGQLDATDVLNWIENAFDSL